jgi:hypothetical protein
VLGQTRFDKNFPGCGLEDIEFGIRLLQGKPGMIFLPQVEVRHEYFPCYRNFRIKKRKLGYSLGYFLQKAPGNTRYFYVEPTWTRYFYRLYCLLAWPLAALAYACELLAHRTGPVNGLLYRWFYRDLRVQLFNGMRDYNRCGLGRPDHC